VFNPDDYEQLVLADGKIKAVLKRKGYCGDAGFIDWVNCTWDAESWKSWDLGVPITDDDVMLLTSFQLERILGFGITSKRDKGLNFYRDSWNLGNGYGFVCIGGQRGTCQLTLNGEGLSAAKEGWETRLHTFLSLQVERGKLTRVDVARDFFNGEYTVNQADQEFDAGRFRLAKSPTDPDCEHLGNWKRPSGKGRTFAVGRRASGKYARIYEKGKQLGSPTSEWVRAEVEFKSADRVLPFDILLSPGAFLAGAYPAFSEFASRQERITTIRETKVCTKDKKEAWIQRQCGKDLFVLSELEPGDTPEERAFNLVNRLMVEELPKWAELPDWRNVENPIHRVQEINNCYHVTGRHVDTGTFPAHS
jgi:phage replication initiation protein